MSARPPVRCTVFQVFFESDQRSTLDRAFVPYDNAGKATEALEFDVFRRLAASASVGSLSHWGAVSWRFGEKTGLSGRELLSRVREAPQVDVWYCNPYPYIEALFPSFWYQGQTTHPGLLEIAHSFFVAADLPVEDLVRLERCEHFSAANYFVGTPRFWSAYLPFVATAIERAEARLSPAMRERLHSSQADPKLWHKGSTYLPFIVERLVPTFLRGPGQGLITRRYALPREEAKLSPELRALRELKDRAIAERSLPLVREWMDRRNRYVKPRTRPEWWAQFADLLNPPEIVF